MRKSKFTETQIISILQEHEKGRKVSEIARENGISDQTFFKWKSKYGGLTVSELRREKELEDENARLKKMFANLSLVHEALKDAVAKKF